MKKSNKNDNHQDGQELSRKLYRSISDSVKRLDDAHSCAQGVGDLFTPTLQIQRSRFQEYCERLIFSEPALFGRKCEELLWRKAYYDVICACKRLKKKEYSEENLNSIQTHINAAIGHYHHFISRLQHHYNIDVFNFVDFAIINLKRSVCANNQKDEELQLAKLSIHRCLIYLGDLNRYKLDIYPNWDPGLASRYYFSAISFKPDYGIPHNQMGTLASIQNRTLDAVYHYMCCLSCKFSFDGTENNLVRLFEKNCRVFDEFPLENNGNAVDSVVQLEPSDRVKRFVCRLLLLIETWFFNRKYAKIYELCHQTNVDLQECLSYSKPIISDEDLQTDLESVSSDSASSPACLTDDAMFKISVICLLCVTKLQKLQYNQLSMAVAFTLSIYSQLLQIATDHIRDKILNASLIGSNCDSQTNGDAETKRPKSRTKISRRRKVKGSSDEEESDASDQDVESDLESGSDEELVLSSSDDECEVLPIKQPKTDSDSSNVAINGKSSLKPGEKVKKIDPNAMLEIIADEKLLQSLKILSDWFVGDPEIVKSCGKTTTSLLKQIVELLNLLNVDLESSKLIDLKDFISECKENESKIVLPEDAMLNGIEIVSNLHKNGGYAYAKNLTRQEEAVLRIMRLISFGHDLVKFEETGMSFDNKNQMFEIQENITDEVHTDDGGIGNLVIMESENDAALNETNKNTENKQNQMKHMGQLWLAAEVRALESRVRNKASLSPYLVLDVDCLTQYTAIVKHLINSKKFIVVVPSIVVSALDDLKREKLEARDAIRWLEMQFHHGNRFCRAQRPQESTSLPLIKYPKKKDKESFMYIQIIECCYYLTQQQKSSSSLVTLLLGNKSALSNSENRDISYVGLARSVEINLELVTDFYDKWKKSYKGKKL